MAETSERPMREHRWAAWFWNRWLSRSHQFDRGRELTAGRARGRVIEIGAGGGATLPYYGEIAELVAVEPDGAMLRYLEPRIEEAPFPVGPYQISAEQLPFENDSFDTAVSNLAYCTIPDFEASLAEVYRVLRPGGEYLFYEHVRGGRVVGRVQDALLPAWKWFGAGCHPNRRIEEAIRAAGFELVELRKRPGGIAPQIAGRARKPRADG